ncbi:hypothetical protein NQ315_002952 [Exocentrus adspersus]|uniref:Ubiquitin-associated protein 1 n=1 Tax=Exocentrus adspersus TaxID=1586481 RepID=A0AAV8W3V8_9CUCU|nr:hypothetical protein NQ315_002952 [Exocentrus adspersus]
MASKQGHDNLESYMDNIRVKISERFKPPPRINVAMTYAQRLTLNKHIQDNMPNYEFVLEKTVLEKVREWKNVRKSTFEQRKATVEQLKEELKNKQLECIEQKKLDEVEVETVDKTVAVPNISNYNSIASNVFTNSSINQQSYINYTTPNDILMPMKASSNYSTILTPIPLTKCVNQQFNPVDKSPFNLSDFENDTSSPFDNMELKSINDMEELAQVLKSEEVKYKTNINIPVYQPYQVVPQSIEPPTSVGQIQQSHYATYSNYNIPETMSYVPVQPVLSNYSHTNGYYYSPNGIKHNESCNSPYLYSKLAGASCSQYPQTVPLVDSKRSNCKSVPDIIKSLEVELGNSHLDNTSQDVSNVREYFNTPTNRPKSTEAVIYPKIKSEDDLDNPFNALPKVQQDLCRSISSMGFPLSRVARVCKVLGNDHKKIVEHLLALSDLLDLGFSEKDVSDALLQCDNDRDKALDKLIL